MKRFATAKDVAELLNICEATVYMWAKDGTLPHIKIKKNYRFDIEKVLDALHC